MEYIILFLNVNLLILLPLVAFGLAYHFLNKTSSRNIIRCFGWNAYAVIGAIGVPIHELSHITANLIFRHKVTKVCLYRPKKGRIDGTLGYVEYRYKPTSLYQQIGVFASGIAPMIGGSLVVIFLLKLLLPETFSSLEFNNIDLSFMSIFTIVYTDIKLLFNANDGIAKLIVFLILSCAISLNIDLSSADLKCSTKGLIFVEVTLAIFSAISFALNLNSLEYVMRLSAILILILTIGLIFSVVSFIISFATKLFKA